MTTPKLPPNVKLLGLASLLNDVASEAIFPLLPQFLITVIGGNRFDLGIIEGVADSTASLLKLFSGAWSDRTANRKGFLLFGYSLGALVKPLIGFAALPWHVFLIRTSDRFGKGIRTAPRDAMIADSTPAGSRGRAFGFHRAMDHLGAAIGPALATLFLYFFPGQLRTLFLLTLLPGLAVVALLAFFLKEVPRQISPAKSLHLTLKPFDNNFRLYLLSLVIFTLGNSSDVFLLVRAGELGVPTFLLPMLWFTFHIAKSLGNLWMGPLVDRIGPRRPLYAGWFLYALVYLGFAVATTPWHVWALFLLYALFYALTEPAEKTFVTLLVKPENKGLAFGWFNFAIGVAALPSSLIFGALYQRFGSLTAFGWGAALCLLSALLLTLVRSPDSAPQSSA